jgi:hypothetical protein
MDYLKQNTLNIKETMKKLILTGLILLSSVLTMNAQWNPNSDNFLTGNLMFKNMNNIGNAGNSINFTSYGDNNIGPRIRSSLTFAEGINSKSSLILSSYWEGYKDELTLSGGNIGMNANVTLKNWTNVGDAGNSINFTSYGDNNIGPRIRSSLTFAEGIKSKSSLILSSYWEGYKDELILSGGNIGMNANVTLKNWTNVGDAGNSINFTSYGDNNIGPRIRSSLTFAEGIKSKSSLILSSYWEGYKNELTLSNGMVGILTSCPKYTLDVAGTIHAKEVKVELFSGCDFVFKKDYKLMNLNELEKFVTTKQHLPEIASEKEMIENGLNMKEFQMKLLQKVEELTLYVIEQNKQIKKQNIEIKKQNIEIRKLKAIKKMN